LITKADNSIIYDKINPNESGFNPKMSNSSQAKSGPCLEVRGLKSIRDDRVLFSDMHFSLSPGHALQIEGPNGSGKTTMLRILCGLGVPTEGEILWNGIPIDEDRAAYAAGMAFIGHAHGIKSELTPLENLQVAMAMENTREDVSLEEILQRVGLRGFEDVPARTLSAGQCRRVAMGRLFMSRAKLWILDEPFTALDVEGQAQIEKMMVDHVTQGGMVILTSHHPLQLADGMLQTISLRK